MSADEHDTITADIASLKAEVGSIKGWMADMSGSLNKLASKIEDRQKTNWGVIVAFLTLILMSMGYARIVMQLEIANLTGPMVTQIEKEKEDLREVDMQFRAVDQIHNLNAASQMRVNALLWNKVYNQTFPPDIYFPQMNSSLLQ